MATKPKRGFILISEKGSPGGVELQGAATKAITNHKKETNPHTPQQVGAEPFGTTKSAITSHENSSNHPLATSTQKGLLSSNDKEKLDTIESQATKNSSDSELRNRSTHTGTQSISSIENLKETLEFKEPLGRAFELLTAHEKSSHSLATFFKSGLLSIEDKLKLDSIGNTSFSTLSLNSGWFSSLGTTVQYTKLTNGLVLLTGIISKSSKPTAGEVIANLPQGFRPIQMNRFISQDEANSSRPVFDLQTNGDLIYNNLGTIPSKSNNLTLSSIRFFAVSL